MSTRAQTLADQFEQANRELIEMVERCPETEWRKGCQAEGWPVAVTSHHVAGGHKAISGFVQTIANGQQLPPITSEQLDQMNAQHAVEYANCGKSETLDLLRRNGAAAADIVRGLSDEQLDRTSPMTMMGGAPISAQQMIENVLIGHTRGHSASIRGALGA